MHCVIRIVGGSFLCRLFGLSTILHAIQIMASAGDSTHHKYVPRDGSLSAVESFDSKLFDFCLYG